MHPSPPGWHPTHHKGVQRHPTRTPTTSSPQSIPHHPATLSARATPYHATPNIAKKHHGNHVCGKHPKAQRTANPNSETKANPEVQSSWDTCLDNVCREHRTSDTPTIGKTAQQARNNSHTTSKQSGQRKAHQRHGRKKLRTKCPKQPPCLARHQSE